MLDYAIALLIGITVQTVFVLLAFWIMIKLQGLNYHFLGLLGVAALVGSLDQILDKVLGHYLGFYLASSISSPIIIITAFIGIKKLTEADKVDVMFTVAVGYALCFAMNMWLIGAIIGDLRPSAREHEPSMEANESWPAAETNSAPQTPASTVAKPAAVAATSFPKQWAIKAAMENGNKSSVSISADGKIYTVYSGDTTFVPVDGKLLPVKIGKIEAHNLTLNINGTNTACPY